MVQIQWPLLVICGPTATGKTQMALELAELFPHMEVVSADSRQIFRYMDIGTAKPTPAERQRLPHHFVDIADPDEEYTAGQFGREGRERVKELYHAGRLPVVVGGSGLYIRSLVDGLFEGNVRDPQVKASLRERAEREGLGALYRELQRVDPETARRLHPNDLQRIVRALEVYHVAGEPISALHKKAQPPRQIEPVFFALNRPREELYRIIEERVEQMLQKGLVEEVSRLRQMGFGPGLQSQRTVGYQEIHSYLDGEISLDEAVRLVKRNTRRFAKRQLTWFGKDGRIAWLEVAGGELWSKARSTLAQKLHEIAEKVSQLLA